MGGPFLPSCGLCQLGRRLTDVTVEQRGQTEAQRTEVQRTEAQRTDSRRTIGGALLTTGGIAVALVGLVSSGHRANPWGDWTFYIWAFALLVLVGLAGVLFVPDAKTLLRRSAATRSTRVGASKGEPDWVTPVIPHRNADFTGREGLLDEIRERLAAGARPVILHGTGGIGKTQIAIEYMYKYQKLYNSIAYVRCEKPELIQGHMADIARSLGCGGADAPEEAQVAMRELGRRGDWLLVFDDAQSPDDIVPWLPGGSGGQVLVTTQATGWGEVTSTPIEVESFTRDESVRMLVNRVSGLADEDARAIAGELGDLPLAVTQAANYLADPGMPAADYLNELRTHPVRMMDQGRSALYLRSQAVAIELAMQRLEDSRPASAQLAEIAAFLAPEPIPVVLFEHEAIRPYLPEPLASAICDKVELYNAVGDLGQSMARIYRGEATTFVMHRLIQAYLRDRRTGNPATGYELARNILAAGRPDPSRLENWAYWERLLPHVLAAEPGESATPATRGLACDAVRYLLFRGDAEAARTRASDLCDHWKPEPDDLYTMTAANLLARAIAQEGDYAEALNKEQDTLKRRCRVLGENHPDTLTSASDVAGYLRNVGKIPESVEREEDIYERRKESLGEDHPDTLASASNLASALSISGKKERALELDEDTLKRRRRVLGLDHPDTLSSETNLAVDLVESGDNQRALNLSEENLTRRRNSAQGWDHPATLVAASNVAPMRAEMGELRGAQELVEDTLARCRRILREGNPVTLSTATNLAGIYAKRRRYPSAIRLASETLAQRRQVNGPDHPDTVALASNLIGYLRAVLRLRAARHVEAEIAPFVQRALGSDRRVLATESDYAEYWAAYSSW
jgi:tetratricopeptide (TPR) repeat protein